MTTKKGKIVIISLIALALGLYFYFDLAQYLNLEYIKSRQTGVENYYAANPLQFSLAFFFAYVFMAAFSIPGATLFTLIAGAIFGLLWGTIIVSFASTIGASLAFLIARYLLKESIQNKYGSKLKTINEGIDKEGGFYLFTLRLVPAFPFFIINLVMGITSIRLIIFYLVSQIGMLPATIIYVNAGTQLAKLESLSGILSPKLLIAFALLGLFPLLAKKFIDYVNRRKLQIEENTS